MAGKTDKIPFQSEDGKIVLKRKWTNDELLHAIYRHHKQIRVRLMVQVYDPKTSNPVAIQGKAINLICATPKDVYRTINFIAEKLEKLAEGK